MTGELRQRVDAIGGGDGPSGTGRVEIPLRIDSGDLTVFRATAEVRLQAVDLRVPAWKLTVEGIDGAVPIIEEIRLVPGELPELLAAVEDNAWSRWRFQDQQPFLQEGRFLAVRRIQVGDFIAGPMAGNIHVDHTRLGVDQMELEARGGRVRGQALAEVDLNDPRLSFRGHVTGFQSASGGTPLDASAALLLRPAQMTLEGRARVHRIGRDHLLEGLDLWDPWREDVQANRLRLALRLGHPRSVQLRFQHGFMDVDVTMGGLAGVVQIDPIRGVALGPILDHVISPILEATHIGKRPAKATAPVAPQEAP